MKKYLITSERAWARDDEVDCVFTTDKEYAVGDTIVLDGIEWTITEAI